MEAERDNAVSQLLETQEERRGLQAQLSAKAAELRLNEGDVRQLEADLVKARRLQKAAPPVPIEMPPQPHVTHSQALATSISRMTLGVTQPPASTAPVMQTALMPAKTTSVQPVSYRCSTHCTSRGLPVHPANRAWRVYLPPTSVIHIVWASMPGPHRKSKSVPLPISHLCAITAARLSGGGSVIPYHARVCETARTPCHTSAAGSGVISTHPQQYGAARTCLGTASPSPCGAGARAIRPSSK